MTTSAVTKEALNPFSAREIMKLILHQGIRNVICDESSVVRNKEEKRGKKPGYFDVKILELIASKGIKSSNVRSFDFVKLAKKLNTVQFFMKTEKPVFPVDIYRAYRSINSLDRNFKVWTKEDDKILTNVVKKYGEGKWRHLSLYLEGNSRS